MSDQVEAALIASLFGISAAIVTTFVEHRRHRKQIEVEAQIEGDRLRADAAKQAQQLQETFRLQEERLKAELRTEFMAESAIQQLLSEYKKMRRFDTIERRLGGFKPDELRKLLVRSGAVRFYRTGADGSRTELWGLRARNVEAANAEDETISPSP